MHSLFAVIYGEGEGGTTPGRGTGEIVGARERGVRWTSRWLDRENKPIQRYRIQAKADNSGKGPCACWGAARRRLECTENRSQGCRHSEICNGLGNVSHCTVCTKLPRLLAENGEEEEEEMLRPKLIPQIRASFSYFHSILCYSWYSMLHKYSFDSFSRLRSRSSRFAASFAKNCKFICPRII